LRAFGWLLLSGFAAASAQAAPAGTETPPAASSKVPSPAATTAAHTSAIRLSARAYAPQNSCPGEYADNLSALSEKVRRLEAKLASYTFCIRTTATYECPSYGADGELIHRRTHVVAHGTGFAYRQGGSGTLLLTNQHVADWPAVTDEDHPAGDVPPGCKRVDENVQIVENEADSYERDDIPLSPVISDPQLDVAVLTTTAKLAVLPWKVGHSSRLKERNIVDVRGFPLGAFKATNVGKVVSPYDHDTYKDWDHDDFIVDALLSSGNSGSPVLAISCKTGEFELVGLYHAGYTHGSALNAVIGIDQIRDMITTLKRMPRVRDSVALDEIARIRLTSAAQNSLEPFFPLGSLTAMVRAREDGSLLYELFNRSFPLRTYPILVLEDVPTRDENSFGSLGRLWIGNRQGLRSYTASELGPNGQQQLDKLLEAMRRTSLGTFGLREADLDANSSRERFEQSERLERALRHSGVGQRDIAQWAVDLADRLAPQAGEPSMTLMSILGAPASPPEGFAAALTMPAPPPRASGALPDPDIEVPIPGPLPETPP